MSAYCYIVECADGTYYTGWTTDPQRRVSEHNAGRGAQYTRARGPVQLIYVEAQSNRSTAMKREYAIKKLSRAQKRALVDERISELAHQRVNESANQQINRISKSTRYEPGRIALCATLKHILGFFLFEPCLFDVDLLEMTISLVCKPSYLGFLDCVSK